jgi:hypothetical protein
MVNGEANHIFTWNTPLPTLSFHGAKLREPCTGVVFLINWETQCLLKYVSGEYWRNERAKSRFKTKVQFAPPDINIWSKD